MPDNASIAKGLELIKHNSSSILKLSIGNHSISSGTYVPKAEAQSPPSIIYPNASSSKTYIAICIDLDAPFPSMPVLGPILHWIQSGLKVSADGTNSLSSNDGPLVEYIAPGPPPPSGPHRYVVFLYEQPEAFDVKKLMPADGKKLGLMSRVRYDLDKSVNDMGLGEAIAVNFWTSN